MSDSYRRQIEREMALADARIATGIEAPPKLAAKEPSKSADKPRRKGQFKRFLRFFRRPFGTVEAPASKQIVDTTTAVVIVPVAIGVTLLSRLVWKISKIIGNLSENIPGVTTIKLHSYPWIRRAGHAVRWLWLHGGGWLGTRAYHWACCDKVQGEYSPNPLATLNTACFLFFVWLGYLFVLPAISLVGGGVYYYGTWGTWDNVYVPNAGVYQNQGFLSPSAAGQVIAARDEIYTVLGKFVDSQGRVEEIRFDLDYNFYFWFYEDSLRPDLAASKMNSQTAFGVKCDLVTTGIYARLPRFVRLGLVKWLDLRPEIVRVKDCDQMQTMPEIFTLHPVAPYSPPKPTPKEGFWPW